MAWLNCKYRLPYYLENEENISSYITIIVQVTFARVALCIEGKGVWNLTAAPFFFYQESCTSWSKRVTTKEWTNRKAFPFYSNWEMTFGVGDPVLTKYKLTLPRRVLPQRSTLVLNNRLRWSQWILPPERNAFLSKTILFISVLGESHGSWRQKINLHVI